MVTRFSVHYMIKDNKKRPCVVISPDELNSVLPYVMICPITTNIHPYPYRIMLDLMGKEAQICLDQIFTCQKTDLGGLIGHLPEASHEPITQTLKELFEL